MIERLLEATQPSGGTARIDQRIRDRLVENGFVHMMRTGKRREQSIVREQLEGAHVQFAIAAQRVAQSAFGFGEGRRIENDEIVLGFRLFRRAQELKDVLLDPIDGQFVALSVFSGAGDISALASTAVTFAAPARAQASANAP